LRSESGKNNEKTTIRERRKIRTVQNKVAMLKYKCYIKLREEKTNPVEGEELSEDRKYYFVTL